jgi:3-hydroxyacyl-CoA dehydrogenase
MIHFFDPGNPRTVVEVMRDDATVERCRVVVDLADRLAECDTEPTRRYAEA